jgi:hypothetical protein
LSLSRYRQVVILCPTAITGGPEAIHQLSLSLNAIGVQAYILHVGPANSIRISDRKIISQAPPNPALIAAYGAYGPQFSAEVTLDEDTLLILPEGLAANHRKFAGCGVAIWWLSVDNFHRAYAKADAEGELSAILARRELIHFHQSAYARDWLRGLGAESLYDLGDYTSPAFTVGPARTPSRSPSVSYNAAKGSDLAQGFFDANPQFEALPLRGYSKAELRTIFQERLLYVDFGHFPGKDRMPREAAVSGGVVFVHRKGSAESYEDFPLPDFFKFSREDVDSGVLAEKLEAVRADPQRCWAQQDGFRSFVLWEKAYFHDQVMRHWGLRRAV